MIGRIVVPIDQPRRKAVKLGGKRAGTGILVNGKVPLGSWLSFDSADGPAVRLSEGLFIRQTFSELWLGHPFADGGELELVILSEGEHSSTDELIEPLHVGAQAGWATGAVARTVWLEVYNDPAAGGAGKSSLLHVRRIAFHVENAAAAMRVVTSRVRQSASTGTQTSDAALELMNDSRPIYTAAELAAHAPISQLAFPEARLRTGHDGGSVFGSERGTRTAPIGAGSQLVTFEIDVWLRPGFRVAAGTIEAGPAGGLTLWGSVEADLYRVTSLPDRI